MIEWFLSAQAILRIGASITTLYSTLGEEGLIHGINETEIKQIITTEDLLPKLAQILKQTPNIQKIIYVELKFRRNPKVEFGSNIDLVTFSQLESSGKSAPKDLIEISPTEDDIALIQYTSGSKTNFLKYRKYLLLKIRIKTSNFSDIKKFENLLYFSKKEMIRYFLITLKS
jgi:long-chain acyl-CoA synthetase